MPDFKDIIGQKQLKHTLLSAIALDKPSHAYIFNGETGSGRDMLAEAFSKTLLCDGNKKDREAVKNSIKDGNIDDEVLFKLDACDICTSCLQSSSSNNPDVIYVTHEKASISVEDIREQINKTVEFPPYSEEYKIYIIKDANKMTEEAQNALLKTIEEPPAYVIFILISENTSMFLPTILSRCVVLNTHPISKEEISSYLVNKLQMEKANADIAANFCQGNMGRAIKFGTSPDFIETKEKVLNLLKHIDSMHLYETMEVIREFSNDKRNFNDYLDLMLLWYRDVLTFKSTQDINLLLYRGEYKAISEQASKRSYEDIQDILTGIDKAKVRLKSNVNFEITIELMLLNIKDSAY
ncbi:MAG: DNA polymerase III subunit [Lachnospiraceae bacterium]|nr:DNA polymerase III subunit [Lachnospiraceae bacterium]